MATIASDIYRRPVFGPTDELFYRCLATSGILGAVFLVAVLLAPIRREAITSIEQLPTRFARLIVEKPVEPVALPPADVVRPGDTKAPGEVGPKGGTNTPEAASGPEPGPGPTDLAPGGGGNGTSPGPNGNGAAGRARAQKMVSSQLAGATASLDRTLSSLSSSLQGVVATSGAGPARRTRSVRAARGADQLGSVDADVHTGGGADLGGSAVAGSWVAIGSLSGTGGGGTGGGSGGGVGDGTGAGSGSGLGGGGGGGGNGGYPGTGGGVGGGSGSGGGGGGAAPGVYRSNASLLAVIQKYTAGIQYCYGNELKRDATLKGKLVVAITVAASGEVTEATVLQNTLGSERLASCALSQIRDWKFPPIPMGLTTFRAPFVFTPPN